MYTSISIHAQYAFPQPLPLWLSDAVEEGAPSLVLQKVNFLPTEEGILVETPVGFTLRWIDEQVYYKLSIDHLPDVTPQQIANILIKVSP